MSEPEPVPPAPAGHDAQPEIVAVVRSDSNTDDPKRFWASWAANQGVPTVLLFFLLISGWYGGSYVIQNVIPKHLESIKAGYKDIEDSHRAEREARDQRFSAELEKDRQLIREMIFHVNGKRETTRKLDE